MPNLEFFSIIAFFTLVIILLIRDRKNIQFFYGIIIKRWKKGIEIIDFFVKKMGKILKILGNLVIIVGIIISFIGIYFLVSFTLKLERIFAIVLPTVTGYKIPGPVVSIPFWYWIAGVFIVIASHETMHAIFARAEKIPIKNYGVILFFFLPIGAFVEINQKKVKKLKLKKKLRIFASGSFGNFVTALVVILLFLASTKINEHLMEPVGLRFEVIPNTPAAQANLSGMIYQIDNQSVKTVEHLINLLNKTEVGTNITILTTQGSFTVETVEHPEIKGKAYIGITKIREAYKYKALFEGYVPERVVELLYVLYSLLFWLFFLNVGIGAANLLPWKPFDGGLIFEEIFIKLFGRKGKLLITICSVIILCLILINLFVVWIIK